MVKRVYDLNECSKRLKLLLRECNLSQDKLAKEIGVSRKSINQYCRGKSIPDDYNRKLLADYFNVDEDYLLGKTEYKNFLDKADKNCDPDLIHKVWLAGKIEKEFNINVLEYPENKVNELRKDIKEYIQFKVDKFKVDNSSN